MWARKSELSISLQFSGNPAKPGTQVVNWVLRVKGLVRDGPDVPDSARRLEAEIAAGLGLVRVPTLDSEARPGRRGRIALYATEVPTFLPGSLPAIAAWTRIAPPTRINFGSLNERHAYVIVF